MKEESSVKESVKTSDKVDGKKEKGKDKGIILALWYKSRSLETKDERLIIGI